jgi:hypothetical protein
VILTLTADSSDEEGKSIVDEQNNFAHLLQNNFSGINLSNDSAGELLDIYRNFHKNDNARLNPMPDIKTESDPRDDIRKDSK